MGFGNVVSLCLWGYSCFLISMYSPIDVTIAPTVIGSGGIRDRRLSNQIAGTC